jgi:hypothetical protein
MAISDDQKLDYLWKKIAFAATKTDTNANKLAANEAIPSTFLNRGDTLWNQADQIPAARPSTSSGVVTVYSDSTNNTVETTADGTSTQYRTWKTGLTNWIPPEYGASYLVSVYVSGTSDSAPETNGTRLFTTGSGNNDEWFFDYASGVLNFIGDNLPNGINFTNKTIYIKGARYTGTIGVEQLGSLSAVDTLTFSTSGAVIDSAIASNVAIGESTISTWNKDNFNFAKLIVNTEDITYGQYQSSEVLLVHDGVDVKLTEYALIHTSTNPMITFNAHIESDSIVLKANANSANNTIKIVRILN